MIPPSKPIIIYTQQSMGSYCSYSHFLILISKINNLDILIYEEGIQMTAKRLT